MTGNLERGIFIDPNERIYIESSNISIRRTETIESERIIRYPDLGYCAFGPLGKLIVEIIHKATLFGLCSIILILSSSFLADIISYEWASQQNFVLICAAIVSIPLIVFKDLKEVSFISLLGLIATIFVVISLLDISLVNIKHGTVASGQILIDYDLIPSAFSAITISFGGTDTMLWLLVTIT